MNDPNLAKELTDDSGEPLDRLDVLLSLHLDDVLDDEQAMELNELLLSDPDARARSIDAAQLHADLYVLFGERDKSKDSSVMPPLSLPFDGMGLPTT
ncbi:hypothetical protein MalM25_12300 [Planctomycetes bacterium MalM25]|nr:hypothetical protein MalM25_12300 [Planctomycetes bacterium MalM25]